MMDTNNSLPQWRSLLFVPATSDRFIESAVHQPADALLIDLEDSVSPEQKEDARMRVGDIADRFKRHNYDVVVRVNRPWRLLVRDLEASVCSSVSAITLPKVPDAAHIRAVSEILSDLEAEAGMAVGHTRIIAMVEDAEGLQNMAHIAAADRRLCGVIVGAEDLAVSMRMSVAEDSLYVPNVLAVAAARRAGIIPIGFVGSVADFSDADAFRARIRRARRLGFDAAFCIHPRQVAIVNEEFSPSTDEVLHARELIDEYARSRANGKAAFRYKDRMVDLPVVEQARYILAKSEAAEAMKRRHLSRNNDRA
jgi:citrate lyase subunit beta/citryl-CoA lyase